MNNYLCTLCDRVFTDADLADMTSLTDSGRRLTVSDKQGQAHTLYTANMTKKILGLRASIKPEQVNGEKA